MKAIMISLSFLAFPLLAENMSKDAPSKGNMTKEQREDMAVAHEKMAACLRSETDAKTCHDELKKACHEQKSCPMHEGMGKGMGRGK